MTTQSIVKQVYRRNVKEAYILPEEVCQKVITDPWFFPNGHCLFHIISERICK